MKYKLIGIAAAVVMLTVTVFAEVLSDTQMQRFEQHRDAAPKSVCTDHASDVFCTHLPLVQITTENGAAVPGKLLGYDANAQPIFSVTANGADSVDAVITITDNAGLRNHLYDTPQLESRALVHVRGNSSRAFDKSSYSLRLISEDGSDTQLNVMGMDAHHEWVLYGPFLDKTLLRNYMWYNIAGNIMDYAPNVRFCEVTLNGEYVGLYVMAESITAGKQGRLDLSVEKKHDRFSGYLLRLDRGSDTPIKNIETFSSYTYRNAMQLNIVYPGTANLTDAMRRNIAQDFSNFEKALYSYDFDDADGYRNRIDADSFADYFLLNEFTCNYDAGWLSTYIYKGIDNRFRMCIWDFNSSCNGYQENQIDTHHYEMQNCLWFFMLTKDEDFTDRLITRYRQLRQTYLSDSYLESYIDDVVAYLGDAVMRNYERWGYSFAPAYDMLTPTERNPRSYGEAVSDVKEFIHERGLWMDENIEALRQYSAESRVKKFNENAN